MTEGLAEMKPRLLSIQHAARYVSVSRATFYRDWLPKVRSIKRQGDDRRARRYIDRESLDRLIDEMLDGKAENAADKPYGVHLPSD